MKFGLLMHWGPYSQWGDCRVLVLSAPRTRAGATQGSMRRTTGEYKRAYEDLKTTFNPVQFDPERWADAAGTPACATSSSHTKHHDGFCMFDTRQTDYKITVEDCPFNTNPRADVAKEIFDAFRAAGFGIGAYFSKPDWHCPDYWWPYFPPRTGT